MPLFWRAGWLRRPGPARPCPTERGWEQARPGNRTPTPSPVHGCPSWAMLLGQPQPLGWGRAGQRSPRGRTLSGLCPEHTPAVSLSGRSSVTHLTFLVLFPVQQRTFRDEIHIARVLNVKFVTTPVVLSPPCTTHHPVVPIASAVTAALTCATTARYHLVSSVAVMAWCKRAKAMSPTPLPQNREAALPNTQLPWLLQLRTE